MVDKKSGQPLHEQVAEIIEKKIVSEVFSIGERLPSVRKFATQFEVSNETIYSALNILKTKGLIDTIPNKGSFIRSTEQEGKAVEKTGLIALIIDHGDKKLPLSIMNPLNNRIIELVDEELQKRSMNLIHHNICYENSLDQMTLNNIAKLVDGIIVVGLINKNFLKFLRQTKLPVVTLFPALELRKIDQVGIDNYNTFLDCTEELLNLGYKGVAFKIGPKRYFILERRLKGIMQAYKNKGIEWKDEYIITSKEWGINSAEESVSAWLEKDLMPNAILCTNDNHAVGALKAVQSRGLSVPDDFGIVGCRNTNVALATTPQLASIDFQYDQLVETAIDLLDRRIDGFSGKPMNISITGSLIKRSSIK